MFWCKLNLSLFLSLSLDSPLSLNSPQESDQHPTDKVQSRIIVVQGHTRSITRNTRSPAKGTRPPPIHSLGRLVKHNKELSKKTEVLL